MANANLFSSSMSDDPTGQQTTAGTKTNNTAFSQPIKDLITSAGTEGQKAYTAPWETFKSADYVAPANIAQNSYWTNTQNLQSPDAFDKSKTAYTGMGDSTFNQAQATQYMDPYQKNVTDTTMAELKRQYDEQLGQLGLQRALGGGLNSSGYALALAKAGQNYGNTAASTYAKLQQTAYENAMAQYNAEQNRKLQVAQGLASLGSNISSSDLARLQAQGLAATDEYGLAKAAKDFDLEEARTEREQPTKNATNYANFISALPREQFQTAGTNETQQTWGVDPSIMSSIFSTSGGILGLLNMNKQLKDNGGEGLWDTLKGLFK
jgi:hypothetical protein